MPGRNVTYLTVVGLVLATYAVSLAAHGSIGSSIAAVLQVATVWLTFVHSGAGPRMVRFSAGLLVVAVVILIAAVVAGFLSPRDGTGLPPVAAIAVYTLNALLYVLAPAFVLRDVVTSGRVDGGTVLGALAAYLQVGLFFAFVYRLIVTLDPTSFGSPVTTGDLLFFSFVTLSTTGYGDIVPVSWAPQTISVIEIVLGQFFLVAAVGKIVAVWVPKRPH